MKSGDAGSAARLATYDPHRPPLGGPSLRAKNGPPQIRGLKIDRNSDAYSLLNPNYYGQFHATVQRYNQPLKLLVYQRQTKPLIRGGVFNIAWAVDWRRKEEPQISKTLRSGS